MALHLTAGGEAWYQDVFYSRLDAVKRYFAGGQQIATRLDDDSLYYHVNDPTGTSLVMVDVNGDEVGRMLYDGYGTVLTNTLPLTLTGTLPDTPDAATGLVHLGGGRYYDPALGRPLQPNPMGGPPTLPQALNRYTATPLGQPGVYEAVNTNNNLTSFALASGSNAISAGSGMFLSAYANHLPGDLFIRANSRILADAGYKTVFRPVMAARGGRTYYLSSLVEQLDDSTFRAIDSGQVIDLVHLESKGLVKYPNRQAFAAVDDTVTLPRKRCCCQNN